MIGKPVAPRSDCQWPVVAGLIIAVSLAGVLAGAYPLHWAWAIGLVGLAALLLSAALIRTTRSLRRQLARLEQQAQEQTAAKPPAEQQCGGCHPNLHSDGSELGWPEQHIQTLSQAVEQSPASIVITDLKGRIEYVNRKFQAISGYNQAEVLSQNPRFLKSGQQTDALYKNLWETVAAGREWHGELCNKRKNGEIYWESMSISPIRNRQGQITHYLAIQEDITGRKFMEEELQRRTEEAQAASLAKSQFLANTNHEIRTPLNGIIGMIGLLLDTELTATQRRYAEVARASGEVLLSLLNNILDFSRTEVDQLELETLDFNLRVTLDGIAKTLAARAHEKGLSCSCRISPDVYIFLQGDPGRLRQVLMALGDNAIKFTERGEVLILVSLMSETDQAVKLRFEVQDTGVGIARDELKLLFNKFQQINGSMTRQFGGVGLGLALSKRLVEKMGGEISVTSIEGQGSRFWFSAVFSKQFWPVECEDLAAVDLHGVRVLIVDDRISNRLVLTEQMALWNLRYEEVAGARQALVRLHEAHAAGDPFQLLITDVETPDMDGAALGVAIKNDPDVCNTILVMLTSIGQRGDARKFQEAGFAAYLTRPVQPGQLYDCLKLVLERATRTVDHAMPLVTRYTLREAHYQPAGILVVEDNSINQLIALKMLEKLGYRAHAVFSGREALEALKTTRYDLVLMDVEMADMDGLETTRRIRSGQAGVGDPLIPVIAMTACTAPEDQQRCLDAGMNDYVSKPFKLKTLADRLSRWWLTGPGITTVSALDDPAAVSPDQQWLPIPGLDRRLGLLRAGGDQELYQRLLYRLIENHADTATAIRQALQGDESILARRLVHTIKGVAGNIGANELEAAARALEQALMDDHQLPVVMDNLANLELCLDRLVENLRNWPGLKQEARACDGAAGLADGVAALDQLLAALDHLAAQLRTRKPKPCAEALGCIEVLSWPAPLHKELSQLAGLVRKYRFSESLNLLESLRRSLASASTGGHRS